MNRCSFASVLGTVALTAHLVAVVVWSGNAGAQSAVRQFPTAAKRGMLTVTAPPDVLINGTRERLAPGVRIRGTNNLLAMSASLVGQTVPINYVREKQGLIQEIWILNPAEQEERRSGLEPVTNFTFGSIGEKPKTDDGKTPFDQLPTYPKQ